MHKPVKYQEYSEDNVIGILKSGILRADGLDAYLWSARHNAVEGPYVTLETDT